SLLPSNAPYHSQVYTLSLHDALPILRGCAAVKMNYNKFRQPMTDQSPARRASAPSDPRKLTIAIDGPAGSGKSSVAQRVAQILRSEEHTSELQSRFDLVCRLLLEKKK